MVPPKTKKVTPPKNPHHDKRHAKQITKSRRASFDIARDYVEMNFAVLMEPELTPKELRKKRRAEAKAEKKAEKQRHRVRNAILSLIGLLIIATGVAWFWWDTSLRPVQPTDSPGNITTREFVIEKGDTVDQISVALQRAGFVRSELAFRIYCRLNNVVIQAGKHQLSPSYSTPEIAEQLTKATAGEIEIQVPPGLTLDGLRRHLIEKYHFSNAEIDEAYTADYSSSLFDGRPTDLPAKTRLEGYIYPETYRIYEGASLTDLVKKSLTQFEKVAAENDLAAKFASRDLTFYEGVTLASIVVKEVTNTDDQKVVAGVFYNRLRDKIVLGSDVTYQYAFARGLCGQDKVALPSCDSVYNTRRYGGLPPGPIANVSLTALKAVADPAKTDYYYFVAGDGLDAGKTFFSKTEAEHEANVAAHCHELCR